MILLLTPARAILGAKASLAPACHAGASKDNEVSALRFLAARAGDRIPLAKRELASKPHRSAYAGDCFGK
jgi:hypothetical protein